MPPSTSADAPSAASSTTPTRIGLVATLIVAACYCVAVHLLIVDHTMPSLTLLVIASPWLLAGTSVLRTIAQKRTDHPALTIALPGIALVGTAWVVGSLGGWLDGRVDVPIFAESVVFLSSLSILFAASLSGDREALVTRLARVARRGDMPPAVVRYTRRVTTGWAVFFAAAAMVSAVLFATQSRELWSAFVNLALWPLTALGFALEYAIRLRVLPDVQHSAPLAGVRTFMQRDDVVAGDRVR